MPERDPPVLTVKWYDFTHWLLERIDFRSAMLRCAGGLAGSGRTVLVQRLNYYCIRP